MRRVAGLAALALASCATPASEAFVYTQQVEAAGIPIFASRRVAPEAMEAARSLVADMLAHRPDLGAVLAREGYRVAILAEEEAITDLPENAHWTRPTRDDPRLTRCERIHYDTRIGALTDREYWNARARGIGGRNMVGSEEDLLGLRTSRYYGETIFVHEFAHNVLYAIQQADPALYAEVEAAYAAALAEALWKDEYASTTVQEYWAEGTQFWFNSNRLAVFGGRRMLNSADLEAYDPRLAAVLAKAYGNRHRLAADPFHLHPARVPPGPIPENTAEVC